MQNYSEAPIDNVLPNGASAIRPRFEGAEHGNARRTSRSIGVFTTSVFRALNTSGASAFCGEPLYAARRTGCKYLSVPCGNDIWRAIWKVDYGTGGGKCRSWSFATETLHPG